MDDVDLALHQVWMEHRDSVLDDLQRLATSIENWNSGDRSDDIALSIERRAHRICGSLTIVGRPVDIDELRRLERRATAKEAPTRWRSWTESTTSWIGFATPEPRRHFVKRCPTSS